MSYPPELRSEVSARITTDLARRLFAKEEIVMSGEKFERICQTVWLGGWAEGMRASRNPNDPIRRIAERMAADRGKK